jgi:hypothetical protein
MMMSIKEGGKSMEDSGVVGKANFFDSFIKKGG